MTNTEFSALTHTTLAGGNYWTALFAKQGSASKAGVFDGDVTFMNGKVGIGTNWKHLLKQINIYPKYLLKKK